MKCKACHGKTWVIVKKGKRVVRSCLLGHRMELNGKGEFVRELSHRNFTRFRCPFCFRPAYSYPASRKFGEVTGNERTCTAGHRGYWSGNTFLGWARRPGAPDGSGARYEGQQCNFERDDRRCGRKRRKHSKFCEGHHKQRQRCGSEDLMRHLGPARKRRNWGTL